MDMNLKPNKHKRISFNTTTLASLGFIGPPKILEPRAPLLFCSEIFRAPLKLGGEGLIPCSLTKSARIENQHLI